MLFRNLRLIISYRYSFPKKSPATIFTYDAFLPMRHFYLGHFYRVSLVLPSSIRWNKQSKSRKLSLKNLLCYNLVPVRSQCIEKISEGRGISLHEQFWRMSFKRSSPLKYKEEGHERTLIRKEIHLINIIFLITRVYLQCVNCFSCRL